MSEQRRTRRAQWREMWRQWREPAPSAVERGRLTISDRAWAFQHARILSGLTWPYASPTLAVFEKERRDAAQ